MTGSTARTTAPGRTSFALKAALVAGLSLGLVACGSDKTPAPPTTPTPTTSTLPVRASGDASRTIEAGQTRPLVAVNR